MPLTKPLHDWNGDGKKDWLDDLFEYQLRTSQENDQLQMDANQDDEDIFDDTEENIDEDNELSDCDDTDEWCTDDLLSDDDDWNDDCE